MFEKVVDQKCEMKQFDFSKKKKKKKKKKNLRKKRNEFNEINSFKITGL